MWEQGAVPFLEDQAYLWERCWVFSSSALALNPKIPIATLPLGAVLLYLFSASTLPWKLVHRAPDLQPKLWCWMNTRTPSFSCLFPCSSWLHATLPFLGLRSLMLLWWWLSQGPWGPIFWSLSILPPSPDRRTFLLASLPLVTPWSLGWA